MTKPKCLDNHVFLFLLYNFLIGWQRREFQEYLSTPKLLLGFLLVSSFPVFVVQMTFQRPATDRQLTFNIVAQTARIPPNEVKIPLSLVEATAEPAFITLVSYILCSQYLN